MLKRLLVMLGIALLIVSIGSLFPGLVYAQCGTGSTGSCVSCHLEQYPVHGQDIWHGIHARKDCCTNCHGGNCSAAEKDLAHVGISLNPLQDVYTNCHACHPDDYRQRAEVFAAELHITPASRITPTLVSTPDMLNEQLDIEVLSTVEQVPLLSLLPTLIAALVGLITTVAFFGASYLTHRLTRH